MTRKPYTVPADLWEAAKVVRASMDHQRPDRWTETIARALLAAQQPEDDLHAAILACRTPADFDAVKLTVQATRNKHDPAWRG